MSIAMLDTAANNGSMMTQVITMVLTLGLMYFMIYRPQKKQQKKDTEMRNALALSAAWLPSRRIPLCWRPAATA